MKAIRNAAMVTVGVLTMLIGDAPPEAPLRLQIVTEAQAILGVWRRTARRVAVVETAAVATTAAAATAASANAAAAAQTSAATAQKEASAQKEAAAAPPAAAKAPAAPPAPQPAATGAALPIGTVAASLPGGCTPTPVGGVEYYYCQGNFYRAVFQGSSLVYVTAQPK